MHAGDVPTLHIWDVTQNCKEHWRLCIPASCRPLIHSFQETPHFRIHKQECLPSLYLFLLNSTINSTLQPQNYQNHNMCPIKNLLTKRSNRDLHNQEFLSPFPNYVSEEHDSKRGSKSKRETVRVLPSRPHRPVHLIDPSLFLATTLLLHLPRSLYG